VRRLVVLLAALAIAVAAASVALPRPETGEERVARIAAELRCPVCQGLSVNDSPSDSAREMRALIEQRVAEGRSDEEIRDEFRGAYGDWILLSPPTGDARGLIWLVPVAAIAIGALLVLTRLRGGTRALAPPTAEQRALLRERARLEESDA
jgi:cytochrome c-type biogenesis protein CcmH